ncbi:LuxR family transcriptional regulator [Nonomuraea sp. WAC 01424]|uniref:helix-turn-helix transcriptional regulator n=1 Tax=Nonomuraea sp. WAC 01424 TaxID=2203200 RepID=UPI00163B94B3|nr:LuxR family transcriptional regulator [Nonomuraea sp. WAC 01424]
MSSGQPLLHRDVETEAIREALSRVRAGGPSVLLIQGSRGMGKTTLLNAALAARVETGALLLMARGHPTERDHPFGVVRRLFEPLMSAGRAPPTVPPGAGPGSAAAGPDLGGDLGSDLGGGLDRGHPVTPDLLHGLYRATRSFTGDRPLIIAVDDVHHTDPQSSQWCSYIARRLDGLPIAMVLTTADTGGPDDLARDLAALPYTRLLRPAPLCATCAGLLMESVLGTEEPVGEDVALACHRLTQGNPLLLRELAGRLARSGVRPVSAELPRVLEIGALALTETALGWLSGSGSGVDAAGVDLLRSLAIVAPEDGMEVASMIAGHGQDTARAAGETLRRAGLVTGTPPDRFAHPRIQQAVLAGMDPGERDRLHRRTASLLYRLGAPLRRSARHLMSAGPTGDPLTVTVLREAAGEAAAKHSWEDATGYLHRALAETDDPDTVLEVTAELGAVEKHRDLPACLRHLRTVYGRVRLAPHALMSLAPFADILVTANSAEAAEVFAGAAETAAATPSLAGTDLLLVFAAQALLWGRSAGRLGLRRLGRSLGTLVSPAAREFLSVLALATGARGRSMSRMLAQTRRCLDGQGAVPVAAVLPLVWGDRLDEASYWAERLVSETQDAGSGTGLALALLTRAEVRYQLGSLEAGLADAEAAVASSRECQAEGFHVAAAACAARVLVEFGDLEAAESALKSVAPYGDWHPMISGQALDALGRVRLAQGRPRDGLLTLLECGRRLTAAGITNPACVPWGTNSILAYVLSGERSAARMVAERELELARAWGAPTVVARALSAGSIAHEGEVRLDMLHEAVALLANRGARLEHARALLRLGIAQRQAGDDGKAHETLALALRLAADCGAVRLAALADKHRAATAPARAAGLVPGQDDHVLTVGERRVTDLVLRGMSNLEVATTLSISKRTVDTHLARIYRKLGIHTRAELAVILTGLSDDDRADLRTGEPVPTGPHEFL